MSLRRAAVATALWVGFIALDLIDITVAASADWAGVTVNNGFWWWDASMVYHGALWALWTLALAALYLVLWLFETKGGPRV